MHFLRLAILNLSREKKRTLLLGGAVAFGVFILTIVLSISYGMKRSVQENVGNILSGHVFVHRIKRDEAGREVSYIEDDKELLKIVKESGLDLESLNRRSYTESARFIFNGKTYYSALEGIIPEEEVEVLSRQLPLQEGSVKSLVDNSAILINRTLKEKLGVELGDEILVELQTVFGQRNVGAFVVSGVYELPGLEGEWASNFCSINVLNKLLDIPEGGYMALALKLKDLDRLKEDTTYLREKVGKQFTILERKELGTSLKDAITFAYGKAGEEEWTGIRYEIFNLDGIIGFVDELVRLLNIMGISIQLLLLGIIIMGLRNTYRLILKERMKEIGTFRALGMYRKNVLQIFFWEPVLLSLFGAVIGLLVALICGWIFSRFSFPHTNLFSLFLSDGHVRFAPPLNWLFYSLLMVVGVTALSMVRLASQAAALPPSEAFRHIS